MGKSCDNDDVATKPLVLKRKPPRRIVRKQSRGQMPLELKPRVRLATRRKRARAVGVSIALIAALACTFGASVFSYHERFTIQDINVVGARAVSTAAVESAFGSNVNDGIHHFFSRANIFLYPQTELRTALLRELPLLQSVSFRRESLLSQAITISVTEREPAYLWCAVECYYMDSHGFIFMSATNPSHFFRFRGGLVPHSARIGQTFLRGQLANLVSLIDGLRAGGYPAVEATVENERDLTVRLESGLLVKIVNDVSPDQVGKDLNLVLSSDALQDRTVEYIDLRYGNRVYYKVDTPE